MCVRVRVVLEGGWWVGGGQGAPTKIENAKSLEVRQLACVVAGGAAGGGLSWRSAQPHGRRLCAMRCACSAASASLQHGSGGGDEECCCCASPLHPPTHPPTSPAATQYLVMVEEEARKKAAVHKRRYAGPMVRWKSRRVGDEEVVSAQAGCGWGSVECGGCQEGAGSAAVGQGHCGVLLLGAVGCVDLCRQPGQ